MSNLIAPIPRLELLETADQLLSDTQYSRNKVNIPAELKSDFKPAYINPGRLLVSGMIPEHMIIIAKREVSYKDIQKGLAKEKIEKQRNQPPLVRAVRGFMTNNKPHSEDDFTPDISAEVTRTSRTLETTLEEYGQPEISVRVEQWSFLGKLTVNGRQFILDPTAKALLIRKRNLSDAQEGVPENQVGYSNSAGYLFLPYSVDAFEDIIGYNTDNSCIESPIPPFTESPADPSVVMHNIMQTLLERS